MHVIIDELSRDQFLKYVGVPYEHLEIMVEPHEIFDHMVVVFCEGLVEDLNLGNISATFIFDCEDHYARVVAVLGLFAKDVVGAECYEVSTIGHNKLIYLPADYHVEIYVEDKYTFAFSDKEILVFLTIEDVDFAPPA